MKIPVMLPDWVSNVWKDSEEELNLIIFYNAKLKSF
jgi:hypothetical protein